MRRELLRDVIPRSDGGWPYAAAEMDREGFPGIHPRDFVKEYFLDAQGMTLDDLVTRIRVALPRRERGLTDA